MAEFLKIECLMDEEVERIEAEIHRRIAEKKALGLLTDRDVDEVIDMRLRPLPDIQDVQDVYQDALFARKKPDGR